MAIDNRPKLMIMKTMVPTVCHGFENPSDAFIRKAQTISNRPARRRKIQAMTVLPYMASRVVPAVMPRIRERSSSDAAYLGQAG
ncbi:hypothetical protein D3C81_2101610 [compost metagenome]